MKTTRREFIKLLTGTVVAISLPIGLLSDKRTEETTAETGDVEFTLQKIEISPLTTFHGYVLRGLGVPKNKKISPAYFAVRIDDKNNYDKKAVIKEVKFNLKEHFKNRRII